MITGNDHLRHEAATVSSVHSNRHDTEHIFQDRHDRLDHLASVQPIDLIVPSPSPQPSYPGLADDIINSATSEPNDASMMEDPFSPTLMADPPTPAWSSLALNDSCLASCIVSSSSSPYPQCRQPESQTEEITSAVVAVPTEAKKSHKKSPPLSGIGVVASQSTMTMKEQRARRNRESAKRSRLKNKLYFEKLEATFLQISHENQSLKSLIERLLPPFLDKSIQLKAHLQALFRTSTSSVQ